MFTAAGVTAYRWTFATDRLTWAANASDVLQLGSATKPATGAAFDRLIDRQHAGRRNALIPGAHDRDQDVSYHVCYRLQPSAHGPSAPIWLEENGRMVRTANGQPNYAEGVIRIMDQKPHQRHADPRSGHVPASASSAAPHSLDRGRLADGITAMLARAALTGRPGAFAIATIDNLSAINDAFGFDAGNAVIAGVADRLAAGLPEDALLFQVSSHKFGIVLADMDQLALAVIAERLRREVRNQVIDTVAGPISATLSLGGIIAPDQAQTLSQVIGGAMQALDEARTRARDCFVAYEPRPERDTRRKRNYATADEIVSALNERRMVLALQPIVWAGTGLTAFHEALLRIERADGTLVPAGAFILDAEQLGLCHLVDHRVAELSVQLLRADADLQISMNVSAQTAVGEEWVHTLSSLVHGDRAILSRLTVEVTETAAIKDLDQCVQFVDALKDLGCRVAIDDFGAGYSSFRNLKALGVDMVKIDGSFVRDCANNPSDQMFIKTFIELARNFELETVAEWVTDQQTAALLSAMGVTYLQGYYFGEPEVVPPRIRASDPVANRIRGRA